MGTAGRVHRVCAGSSGTDLEAFDQDVLIVRRSSFLLAVAAAPAILGAELACTGRTSALAVGAALAWLGLGLLFHVWRRNPAPNERRAHARADARGLFIDGRLVLRSSRIRGGWLQPKACGPPWVRVRGRGAASGVDLAVRDVACGRALLRALAVEPTRVSAQYWAMAQPWGEPRRLARITVALGLLLAFGVAAGRSSSAALALVVVGIIVLVVGSALPTRVTVGADGVLLQWLGTMRFVRWSSVADIQSFEHGTVLALAKGEWLTLRMPAAHEQHHADRDAMLERMREAWRAHGQGRSDQAAARLVRRAGGRTREWVRAVRAIATSWDGYRAAGIPNDRLWSIVEDPSAGRASRTGAALALAQSLDVDGRARLRGAACSCAEPRLRIALTTAASPAAAAASDDELAAALDAIECDGQVDDDDGAEALGE